MNIFIINPSQHHHSTVEKTVTEGGVKANDDWASGKLQPAIRAHCHSTENSFVRSLKTLE